MIVAVSISGVFLLSPAFADEEQTVRIPLGAVSPSCANDDSCYVPSKVTINEGHEVEWINEDSTIHTVTSGTPQNGHDGFFDSGVIIPRGEFEFTFNDFDVGTYPYYCTAHPWMVGSVIVVDYPVGVSSSNDGKYDDDRYDDDSRYDDDRYDDDSRYDDDRYDDDSRYDDDRYDDDDSFQRDSYNKDTKSLTKSTLFDNQRMFGKYKVTVDWIRDLPAVGEINGIEILVSDTAKKGHGCGGGSHGDKGSHGDSMKGMSGHEDKGKHGCGGGSHGDKGSHDDSMKGMSGHEDKGKHGCGGGSHGDKGKHGGHEGGCPHFKMVKQMIPQIELLENGVNQVDRSLKVTLSVGSNELTLPLTADGTLSGRYTTVFVPTAVGYFGVEVHGTIHGSPVSMMVKMDKVLDKSQLPQFP